MRPHPRRLLLDIRRRDGRVMQQPELVFVARVVVQEIIFVIEAEAHGYGLEDHFCVGPGLPVKACHEGAETG